MPRIAHGRHAAVVVSALALTFLSGCANIGTKVTGTVRSGTEQLLLTGTADRAVGSIDFRPLAGARVFLDASKVAALDGGWVVFSLRRAMAEQGLLLVDACREAQVIVEAAVGAYGTDDKECSLSLPGVGLVGSLPVPITGLSPSGQVLTKKVKQHAVVKLALFAYDAHSRRLVWESGTMLASEQVNRHSILGVQVRRSSSLPELEHDPRRRSFFGRLFGSR
jgi:hypothetical protein